MWTAPPTATGRCVQNTKSKDVSHPSRAEPPPIAARYYELSARCVVPTIKYFNAETGKAGQTYEGERTFDDFLTFSNENLGQSCSNDFKSACSRKEKKVLKKYNSMTAEERAAIIKEADETVEKATKEAEAEVCIRAHLCVAAYLRCSSPHAPRVGMCQAGRVLTFVLTYDRGPRSKRRSRESQRRRMRS
jgi:hypothetical protein